MNTNKLDLKMEKSNTRNSSTSEVRPSNVRKGSPTKVSQKRPNTPENDLAKHITPEVDCQGQSKNESPRKNTTYPTPLFSLFPPVSQDGAIFGEEDPKSTKSWKREYRNARYLMERQKARYLAFWKGREKAVLCKDCQTKEEKALKIAYQNNTKQIKSKHCDNVFMIEGHVVKESEKRLFDSTTIPTNSYLSRNYEMKTSFEGSYVKHKPIATKKPALSKISYEKLQPWLTEDKTKPRVKTQNVPHGSSSMYLPHHC